MYSVYLGLYGSFRATLGPEHILYRYMDPWAKGQVLL